MRMRGGGEGGMEEWQGGRDDGDVWIDLVMFFLHVGYAWEGGSRDTTSYNVL
jgi:hypothetical protein